MQKNKPKDNIILFIIKLPFKLLMYVALGCYYTLYVLLFPFIIVFNKIGNGLYKVYRKSKVKKINLQEIAPNQVNLNTEVEEKPKVDDRSIEEKIHDYFQKRKENSYFTKKERAKEEVMRKKLLESLRQNAVRNETPVTYQYTARDPDGKKVINTFYAYSRMEVYTYLETEGYRVIKIISSKMITLLYGPTKFGTIKLRNKDLIFWLTQLSTYLKSGIPLTDSMRILSKQLSSNPRKKRLFDAIIYNLTLGDSFSKSMEKQHNSFPALLINMIKTAEVTGEITETLDDMANYYTDVEATRKQMISAMTYPSIISIFSIAVVVFILIYVIPQFEAVYENSGTTINGFTLFIINLSDFLKKNIMNLLAAIVVIIAAIAFIYKKVKSFRYFIQYFLMHMPVIKNIIIYKEMSIFAKTFASLLKNNVFITESMSLLSNITNNELYKKIMFRTIDNIARGEKISRSFKNHWAVPEVAYYMIVTGESTGELANMMGKVAEYYQLEHKSVVNTMKAFIEPVMIIVLAGIVGGIIMAIIIPMFGLYSQIK